LKIKKKIKAVLPLFLSVCFFTQSAGAEVLGSVSQSWETNLGGGAVYKQTVYTSSSVGKQTENYVEYTPNSESVPIVVNGSSVYGKRTITSAAQYMEKNNLRPLIGINADFFSVKTGIPMGYTIIDGELYSKESGIQDAVGFREDGSAFIDKLGIDASLTHNETKIGIQYVNKWPQDGFSWVYMLTDDYGNTTKTNFNALYVICTPIEGNLALNTTMQLRVDEVYIKNGEIAIPDGKYVFVMDVDGDKTCFNMLASLAAGDTLKFANSVYGAEHSDWTQAKHALSSIGGRLLNNGVVGSGFMTGAAPRTAVGIKADGTVVFYTIDGRLTNHSYGAQVKTLAYRMAELGCVDAINLDGGGSTAIGAMFPGTEEFKVTNIPSDGALRQCANYIFLRDMRERTNIPWYVEWRENPNHNYVAGVNVQLEPTKVFDTGNYKMDSLTSVTYTAENSGGATSEVNENGLVMLKGTGKTKIHVTGESYSKTFSFEVYETPEEIRVKNATSGDDVSVIELPKGGMCNLNLEAAAYVNGIKLECYPSLLRWEIDENLGTVDEDGNVYIKDNGSKGGSVRVTLGELTKEIPVIIGNSFSDISGHWAKDIVEEMADVGIINGMEENGKMVFKPDSSITRIQFAAIICKSLGIDADDYVSERLTFTDTDKIQPWGVNYIKAMTSMGYINGRSDDNGETTYFDPDSSISRAEAFTIIGRTIDSQTQAPLTYSDAAQIPSWAREAFGKLAALGIITGFEDNSIKPNNTTTRAEAAALVSKLMKINE
jgi:exopolysaccharide biosynthesis protein